MHQYFIDLLSRRPPLPPSPLNTEVLSHQKKTVTNNNNDDNSNSYDNNNDDNNNSNITYVDFLPGDHRNHEVPDPFGR